jgi:hypothetical protein
MGQRYEPAVVAASLRVSQSPPPLAVAERKPIWPVAIILAAVYAPFLVSRFMSFNALWFVHIGRQMLGASHTSTVITPDVDWQSPLGYDGQYYWALAVDPVHAKDYMPTNGGFVYSRPLYPGIARLLALGSPGAVPYTMLVINLLAVVIGTLAIAVWLRRRGLSPALALLYGLFPGLVFSTFRDLTEPLAFAFVTLAGLALDQRRSVAVTAALLALAGLTRETTLVFALPVALALGSKGWHPLPAARGVRWRRAALFLVATVGPLLAWRVVVSQYVGGATQERGTGLRWFLPFDGILHYLPWDAEHWLIVLTVVLPTLMALVGAGILLRRCRTRAMGLLLALNAAAFVVFLPRDVDVDYGAAGRASIGVILALVACLPAWRQGDRLSRPAAALAAFWSLPWYVIVSIALGVPGIALITS